MILGMSTKKVTTKTTKPPTTKVRAKSEMTSKSKASKRAPLVKRIKDRGARHWAKLDGASKALTIVSAVFVAFALVGLAAFTTAYVSQMPLFNPNTVHVESQQSYSQVPRTKTPKPSATPLSSTSKGNSRGGKNDSHKGGSHGNGSGTGGSQVGPVGTADCTVTEAENPTLFSECRSGYLPPSLSFASASCLPGENEGDYIIRASWSADGGNYATARLLGLGTSEGLVDVISLSGATSDTVVLDGSVVTLSIGGMNGLDGEIDRITSTPSPRITVGQICGG